MFSLELYLLREWMSLGMGADDFNRERVFFLYGVGCFLQGVNDFLQGVKGFLQGVDVFLQGTGDFLQGVRCF